MHAIDIVKEKFPNVESVIDSNKSVKIRVTKADSNNAKVRRHEECAMAVACKREIENCDGAIISLKSAYIIKGKKAYRFTVPESVAREVTSFDRKAGFSPGDYHLSPPAPATRLGARSGRKYTENRSHESTGKGMSKRFQHFTDEVRIKLGTK